MYGSLQCRNVIDNLAYTITEVKNYLYSPKLDFVFDNNFLFGGGGEGEEEGGVVLVVSLKQSQMRNLGSLCFVCY